MQITIRIPDDVVKEADEYVDHIHFRSRAHLITVVLAEWLKAKKEEYEDGKEKKNERKLS